jgi:hypothetical protein
MRNLLICIISCILGGTIVAAEAPQPRQEELTSTWMTGTEWAKRFNNAFQEGKYNKFLNEADQLYQQGIKQNKWQEGITKYQEEVKTYNEKLEQASTKKEEDEWTAGENERKKALKELAKAYPTEPISAIIEDLLNLPQLSSEQQAIRDASLFPLMKDSPLKRELYELDLAYFIKSNLLFEDASGSMDDDLITQNNTALYADMLNKMMAAAQKYKDKDIIDRLSVKIDYLPTMEALLHDQSLLLIHAKFGQTEIDKKLKKIFFQ